MSSVQAWVSNREDTTSLHAFLNAFKTACGIIEPEWFMSDDAEQYFNAWREFLVAIEQGRYSVCGTLIVDGAKHYMIT